MPKETADPELPSNWAKKADYMRISLSSVLLLAVISVALLASCSKADQEHAKAQADETAQKTRTEARKLKSDLESSLKGTSTSEAGAKLHRAGEVARTEAAVAGRKLDHATIVAKVKASLASDVGLSTMANVRVDSDGSTVTLTGTVKSADQKRLAEEAAGHVEGVTRVVNQITVQP